MTTTSTRLVGYLKWQQSTELKLGRVGVPRHWHLRVSGLYQEGQTWARRLRFSLEVCRESGSHSVPRAPTRASDNHTQSCTHITHQKKTKVYASMRIDCMKKLNWSQHSWKSCPGLESCSRVSFGFPHLKAQVITRWTHRLPLKCTRSPSMLLPCNVLYTCARRWNFKVD